MGPIHWSYVTESVGLPFLDPGTTVIKFEGRTIYKAQRGFQESVPFAQSIETSDKSITWNDGEFRFHLAVDRMKAAGQNGAVTGNQPKNAEVSSYISILQELQQFARDNRYNDSHPKLRTLINALLPATLSSEQLYRLGVSTFLIAYPQEAGADIPFDNVFAYASRRCAELLSVRADSSSAHYLPIDEAHLRSRRWGKPYVPPTHRAPGASAEERQNQMNQCKVRLLSTLVLK